MKKTNNIILDLSYNYDDHCLALPIIGVPKFLSHTSAPVIGVFNVKLQCSSEQLNLIANWTLVGNSAVILFCFGVNTDIGSQTSQY